MPKDLRKKSQKREKQIAEEINGRAHVLSGGAWNKKGDVSNDFFLIEDKFTLKNKYILNDKTILKLLHQARDVNKIPVFRFGFVLNNKRVDFAILRETDVFYGNRLIAALPGNHKSLTFPLAFLEELYRVSSGRILYRFSMPAGSFVLLMWEDFLDAMEMIRSGDLI